MRAAVESMGGDVASSGQSIERLEPHLEDVSGSRTRCAASATARAAASGGP